MAVHPASAGIPRAPAYSGSCPPNPHIVSPTGLSPSTVRFPNTLQLQYANPAGDCGHPQHAPQPPTDNGRSLSRPSGLGSSPFAHHYSGNLLRFLFLRVLRCFTSPGAPRFIRVSWLLQDGLPHSGISGSKAACASPKLFAAYHALLRPSVPRHPPYALYTLTSLLPIPLCLCQCALEEPEPVISRAKKWWR